MGCGGFIGSHLLRAIFERTSWRVFGVDLDSYRIQELLSNPRFEFLSADLADPDVVERIAQFPIVVNLAAICTPGRYMAEAAEVIRSNYDHPRALADACAKSGSWFSYEGTRLAQGRDATKQLMIDNPELAEEIEKKIMAKITGKDYVPTSSDDAEEPQAE